MPKHAPLEKRFWRYVVKGEHEDDCWSWTGTVTDFGYGQLTYQENKKAHTTRAPLVSYRIHYGEIPKGKCVLHSCDNPSCANPNHLWIGTKGQNTTDMVKKGRHKGPIGEMHPSAKLTESKVSEIKRRFTGKIGEQQILAKEFGVSDSIISAIKTGKYWKHVIVFP
jgi:hypothetical protein